ncbi:MAG: FAD-dependent monooxygenase [Candidatus Obscuribacter sp.]|nr:FAD-dependent monooxygenase [Candidatus Obscuribacter sp.]
MTIPVLITGAGPTGLTLAADLKRRGIDFRIIDKAEHATAYSKAIVLHARTLELLENMGVVERFLEHGLPIRGSNFYAQGKRIVHLNMDEIESHFKYILAIPQNKTEELLAQVVEVGGTKVERSCELIGFEDMGDYIQATVRHLADNHREEIIKCDFLVGTDGAHSIVRKKLGFTFEGRAVRRDFGAADVACELQGDEVHGYLSETGLVAFFPFGEGRYRIIFDVLDGKFNGKVVDPNEPLTLELVNEVVSSRGPKDLKVDDPRWMSWFKIHRRFADSYRKGRAFIAGDAAHIHSPVGGVGMNTGMQDALNLGWKLALVIKGQARFELLDTYEEERRKVGQTVLKATHLATKFVTLRHPVALSIRNNLMHILATQELVQQRILRAGSLTGVSYRGSSISTESHPPIDDSISRSFRHNGTEEGEKPGFGSWIEFARAPVAGDRMLDGEFLNVDSRIERLNERMSSSKFHLLLFDGYVDSEEGYKCFEAIEKYIGWSYKDLIEVHVVVPKSPGEGKMPAFKSVIYDNERTLHKLYGASSECLYLIRPDGYIAFRSQPANNDELAKYLHQMFVEAG